MLPTGPTVTEIEPADGSANVPTSFLPKVKFSEPVDRATLAEGIRLKLGELLVPIEIDHQGDEITIDPVASLLPGATYRLEVGTEVADLQGRLLSSPRSASFLTTAAPPPTPGIDAAKLRLYEPDFEGLAKIVGLPGAVPADSTMWVENVETVTVVAGADGSFELEIPAEIGDNLFLTVLVPGQSAAVRLLGPWLVRGDLGAWVSTAGGKFSTAIGLEVTVERDTFATSTKVGVVAKPAPISTASRLDVLLDFELELGGPATKPLLVRLPAPAGPAAGTYMLNRYLEALGRRGWMAMDLLRRDGAFLTNGTIASSATGSLAARSAGVAAMRFEDPAVRVLSADDLEGLRTHRYLPQASRAIAGESGSGFAVTAREIAALPPPSVGQAEGLPGLRTSGRYQVVASVDPVSWLQIPVVGNYLAVGPLTDGSPFLAMALDEALGGHQPHLSLPRFPDEGNPIEVLDLATGYQVYQGIPPAGDEPIYELPIDLVSDHTPPIVAGGAPFVST